MLAQAPSFDTAGFMADRAAVFIAVACGRKDVGMVAGVSPPDGAGVALAPCGAALPAYGIPAANGRNHPSDFD